MPSIYIDAIAKLTDAHLFPSRSEAIRVALRDFLKSELGMVESLLEMNENEGKVIVTREAKKPVPVPGKALRLAPGALALARTPSQGGTKPVKKVDMRTNKAGWGDTRDDLSDAKIASIKHQLGMQ